MKKIINAFPIPMLLLIFLSINSCMSNRLNNTVSQPANIPIQTKVMLHEVENGDLIFVGAQKDHLSGAINRVTNLSKKRNYDHVGLIEKTKDSIFVLHSTPNGGSIREEIRRFYENQKTIENELIIYRLLTPHTSIIDRAITGAKTLLGKPYNWSYILHEDSYYCSDFIERAFRKDSIFELIPMNFKDPTTNEIDDFWYEYYQKIGKDVPQNQPGTNPNQFAESNHLREIGPLLIEEP